MIGLRAPRLAERSTRVLDGGVLLGRGSMRGCSGMNTGAHQRNISIEFQKAA